MKLLYLYFKSIPLVVALILVAPKVSATHFMGVDITYECLPNSNNCVFRIFHNTYYDCAGAATIQLPGPPFPPSLQTFQPASCIQPTIVGAWVYVSYVEVTPVCPQVVTQCTSPMGTINGVLEARFYADYDFCNTNCSTYNIIWGSCCRNGTITSGAANDGIFSGSTQINLGQSPCNSSPYFTSLPVIYICAGSGVIYDQGAFDQDGDSLVFSLTACEDNATSQVGYNAGFSAAQPLGPSWQLTINSQTGELVIAPRPGNIVTAVICEEVEEYRNGVKIGSITRDMQVTVINCSGINQAPQADSIVVVSGGAEIAPLKYLVCGNDTLKLDIFISDADTTQSVSISASSSIPGIKVSSGTGNPAMGRLAFCPGQTGTYFLPVTITDDDCPIPGQSIVMIEVEVNANCLSASITGALCGQPAGTIDLTVSGAPGPYSYLWSTGDTTEDISNLIPGSYTVTVTNSAGIAQTHTFYVNASNISLIDTITKPTCASPVSGSISVTIGGGIPPYSYLWNTGNTTSSLSNIPAGGYSVTVNDGYGCVRHAAFIVDPPDSCFNVIEGLIFDDQNGNCIQDAGEFPIPNMIVDFSPGGAVMTGPNGKYSYRVSTGNYSMQIYPRRWQSIVCPPNGVHAISFNSLGNVHSNLNFSVHVARVQEISVDAHHQWVRPGSPSFHYLRVNNNGNVTVSGTMVWEHDSIFAWMPGASLPTSYNTTARIANWSFFNLGPYQSQTFLAQMTTDSTTPGGTVFTNEVTVLPILGDSIPANNSQLIIDSIRASFDPNDKQVSPAGIGPLGLIEPTEQEMTYTVRFQNTGNDTAFYVVIRDTIDNQNLDVFSFQRLNESHLYQLSVENDRVLVFRFNNINLPDSTTNFQESQGFVSFKLSHTSRLPIGTQIRNGAAIYFDFNTPIITNIVRNTIFAYPEIDMGTDTTICEGEPLQAVISSPGLPPYTFVWSDGTVDANNVLGMTQTKVQRSGTYEVTVTDALGVTAKTNIQVTVKPSADATFGFIPVGLTVAFSNTKNGNTSWIWNFGDGKTASAASTQLHTYEKAELFIVTLITSSACGIDTVSQEVDLRGVAIDDALFAQSVQLVPHPVQDVSILSFANVEHASYRLRILDLQGRVVKAFGETRSDRFEISQSGLAAGVYLYELIGTHAYFGKMVVK